MKFFKIIKNKYLITVCGLLVWLLFFDKNDVFTQWDLVQRCKKLTNEREYYKSEIEKNIFLLSELKTNMNSLETFARERYLMKADNEDVFVFSNK
ncbi:MAG: septum formation initiator family protein [Bacteroidetes bacterium]|nr:septum formation initiator family protein [Bacteroidota bacterium]